MKPEKAVKALFSGDQILHASIGSASISAFEITAIQSVAAFSTATVGSGVHLVLTIRFPGVRTWFLCLMVLSCRELRLCDSPVFMAVFSFFVCRVFPSCNRRVLSEGASIISPSPLHRLDGGISYG